MKKKEIKETFTNEELGLEPGARQFTKEEARAAYLEWQEKTSKLPGAQEAIDRAFTRQKTYKAMRRMRERAAITQAEIARRMEVKPTAVSRLERFGASTLQALFGYARACGYELTISAKSRADQFAFS